MLTRLWIGLFVATCYGQTGPPGCTLARAIELHQSGDLSGAVREYQACISAGSDRPEVRSNLGAVFAKLGRYQEAIEQYREALKSAGPEISSRLRYNLALAYYKAFQVREAADELETLHAANPGEPNVTLLLADCRLRTGEFKQAIDLLLPLESTRKGDTGLDYVLGMALVRDGRVAEGQVRVDRILGRGESAEGHLLLGTALFSGGNYPAAVQEFAKAEAIDPQLPSLHSYYGRALLFTGDAEGAVKAFRRELAVNPNDFDSNLMLASILAHRGESGEAHALLEKAVQVRPDSKEARDALANGFPPLDAAPAGDGGVPTGTAAPAIAGLDLRRPAKPVVLVFGSYTCPKLRSSSADLKRLSQQFGDSADFRLVYIKEAHASGGAEDQWQSSINEREGVRLAAPVNLTEKEQHAALCLRKLDLPWKAVVDGMDGAAESAYQAWPSRVYVIGRDGRVVFNSRLGELDFRPAELENALRGLGGRSSDGRGH